MSRVVHMIYKTHLDVGYTDYAKNVVKCYYENYIPSAINVARQLRARGGEERFVWTTGSWLIYDYLENASPANRRKLEQAIVDGDITWHAMPFTMHVEIMGRELLEFGLSLSKELDERFGRKTIAAKMSDIPSHTRAMLPVLADYGVKFFHIGVNGVTTPPNVPPVFLWRHSDGSEVIFMYNIGVYGEAMEVEGIDDVIAFQHTLDNRGPQNFEQVLASYEQMREQFPGAELKASTMDSYARSLLAIKDQLPVVTEEIGDPWINGTGSDPKKISWFLGALRLRRKWLRADTAEKYSEQIKKFSGKLLMIPEHTWGMSIRAHLSDFHHYSRKDFDVCRLQQEFKNFELSWAEQREYLEQAVDALKDTPLAEELSCQWQSLEPEEQSAEGWEPLHSGEVIETEFFKIGFGNDGTIDQLETKDGKVFADSKHRLGLCRYEKFSQANYDRYINAYLYNMDIYGHWGYPGSSKPGMWNAGGPHKEYLPSLEGLYQRQDGDRHRFLVKLSMPGECVDDFGAPARFTVEVEVLNDRPALAFKVQWFGKSANRLPEAIWFSFVPLVADAKAWTMTKLGETISPLGLRENGARKMHAVENVCYDDGTKKFTITNIDSRLVAPGEPGLLRFDNEEPPVLKGMHYNLLNNVWGTNFVLWYEDDASFRFIFEVD